MPVKTKKVGKKFRVVESSNNRIVKRGGKAVDSGGSTSKVKIVRQVQAINISEQRSKGRRTPRKRR